MNKQRLEQMVTMLRALPPEKRDEFNMGTWNCGTSACAVGNACVDPVFMNQGLGYDASQGDPIYGRYAGWLAVEKFFELDGDESEWLFGDWHYPRVEFTSAEEVADRINEFIESDGSACSVQGF